MLHVAVKPYYDEILKLLNKARGILNEAMELDIDLKFDLEIEERKLDSYNDVIFYKNYLSDLKERIKILEKDFKNAKISKSVSDLSAFTANMEEINNIKTCIIILNDYEIDVIKQIADSICNRFDNCFVLLANVNDNNVNIIAKSNSDLVNCGAIVKELAIKCSGNGGGSKSFAQGGGSDAINISKYLDDVKKSLMEL